MSEALSKLSLAPFFPGTVLSLLEAGTDLSKLDDFARYAEGNHWLRVTEW